MSVGEGGARPGHVPRGQEPEARRPARSLSSAPTPALRAGPTFRSHGAGSRPPPPPHSAFPAGLRSSSAESHLL